MDGLDEAIHQPVRLRIMATLKGLPEREWIDFVRLRDIVGATDGNLGAHMATLENAGLVRVDKGFVGKRPRTRMALTAKGRAAFARYLGELRAILGDGP